MSDLPPTPAPSVSPDYRGPAAGSGQAVSPLTPEQLEAVRIANERARKIRRTATIARTDGGITALFAVCAILSFCMGWEGPVLGVILGAVALNAFRGAKRLVAFDADAPAILALNQLYLAGAIILYALYELHAGLSGSSGLLATMGLSEHELDSAVSSPFLLWILKGGIYWLIYGGLIVGTILAQGITALYYRARSKNLDQFLKETPRWVIDVLATQK